MMLKLIYYLPIILINALWWVLPVNRYTYRPSSEIERALGERLRNAGRLATWRFKRARM